MKYEVENIDDFGRGIITYDGKICFIENAIDGEIVSIKDVCYKKKFYEGKIDKIIKKSNNRCQAMCKYYDICGGCSLEHLTYEYENNFKLNKVLNIIHKFSKLDISINKIVSDNESCYRNKITLHVKDGVMGLYKKNSHDIVEIDRCLLANDKINEIVFKLKDLVKNEKLIKKIMIRVGNKTNDVMLDIDGVVKDKAQFIEVSDSLSINNQIITNKYITSKILDYSFYVSSKSFFQVNSKVCDLMYSHVINLVNNMNVNNVLDLYCGVGTIGICISKYVKNVLGVEVVKDAVVCANKNKIFNNISNINFICGKCEDVINDKKLNTDLVIVDPPRMGIDKGLCNLINASGVKNIIYISCDPVTFSRDLKILNNYNACDVTLFNMFPRTYHVETVLVLEKKDV